jgi:hypothetical protein
VHKKLGTNPMDHKFKTVTRCGAKTRRGTPCQCPALRRKRRCRLHGGRSTGPRSPEGKWRVSQNALRHGQYTRRAILERFETQQLLRASRGLLARQRLGEGL